MVSTWLHPDGYGSFELIHEQTFSDMNPANMKLSRCPSAFCIRCRIPSCCYSPKMIFSAKALLFDMDGVLIDSAPAVERVWRRWALAHNLDPDHVVAQAHGRRSIETIRAVAPHMDAARENVHVEQMEIDDKKGVTALPGSVRLLQGLPQSQFAVVTSATRPLAVARLGYAGLAPHGHMITADDVLHGKPSPEPYLKGAALLAVNAGDCLVFEDTPAGVAAARSAGISVIALHTTYPALELAAADAIVASLADVKVEPRGETIVVEVTGRDKVDRQP
jgi:sugar-phosphatase